LKKGAKARKESGGQTLPTESFMLKLPNKSNNEMGFGVSLTAIIENLLSTLLTKLNLS